MAASKCSTDAKVVRSEEESASFLSRCLLLYLNPLFDKGSSVSVELQPSDLGVISQQDRMEILYEAVDSNWKEEMKLKTDQRSLWRVLWKTVGYEKLYASIFLYAVATAETFGPITIMKKYLIKYFDGIIDLSTPVVVVLVSLLFILPVTSALLVAHSSIIVAHLGVQFRNALIGLIYRKALRLSPSARQLSSVGQIVNMFSNDTVQMQRYVNFMNNLPLTVPTVLVALYMIYMEVGISVLVGTGLIVLMLPFVMYFFRWMNHVRKQKVSHSDIRIKLMNEVLNGIRIIKYYAWESAFQQRTIEIRDKELTILRTLSYMSAVLISTLLQAIVTLEPVAIFLVYIALGNTLDTSKAFAVISLFNLIQSPFFLLPLCLQQYIQAVVSAKRILQFLYAEELTNYIMPLSEEVEDKTIVISINNASLAWEKMPALPEEMLTILPKHLSSSSLSHAHQSQLTLALDDIETGSIESMQTSSVIGHTLSNLTVQIKHGQLIAVVGATGSGKSSFLNALLGEMFLISGQVQLSGRIAYCDQRPWILNDTVQGNITFGLDYDEARFDHALYASYLENDLTNLPGGVLTEIGERGSNLSGGQRARIALARAVYSDADIYLFDDPLSAVDANVGRFLFHECINKELKEKTRILVTHQVQFLPHCDMIIVLEDGRIKAFGSYEEVLATHIDVSSIVAHSSDDIEEHQDQEQQQSLIDVERIDVSAALANTPIHHHYAQYSPRAVDEVCMQEGTAKTSPFDNQKQLKTFDSCGEYIACTPRSDSEDSNSIIKTSAEAAKRRKEDGRLSTTIMSAEINSIGYVTSDIYTFYIRAGGIFLFAVLICFVMSGQLFVVLSSYWLQYWGTVSNRETMHGTPLTTSGNLYYYLIGFAMLSFIAVLLFGFRSFCLAIHSVRASSVLHDTMVKSTFRAPISFFDTTPLGQILNRFSSDLLTIDEELSQSMGQLLIFSVSVLGSIGAIGAATKGTFFILAIPLMYFYYQLQKYFRHTNTTIARFESISRTPMYSDFSEALNGLSSIRAYCHEALFIQRMEATVNANTIVNITQQLAPQWLSIRLNLIGALISFSIALIATCTPRGFIPSGFLAVGLTYSFQLTVYLKFLVRAIAVLEVQMSSVERVKAYVDNMKVEGKLCDHQQQRDKELSITEIPVTWPEKGEINATQIAMRYRDGPLVLRDLSFQVKSFEKIGVVGRTGSGKSSLMTALFRMEELSSGSLFIDGLDITTVPISHLRKKIGIIPQEPIVFNATLRFNLDPFEEYSDNILWSVLQSVNMKEIVSQYPNQLQEEIPEGGENFFSMGQKQLICIARAVLRKPKILVMDEATASIDNETDQMIQRMIREQFQDCTILTIAHRLNTIIDSDRIMMLDTGILMEYDSPSILLSNHHGMFYALWKHFLQSHR